MVQNACLQDFILTSVHGIPGQLGLGGAVQTIAEADRHPRTDVKAHAGAGLECERRSAGFGKFFEEGYQGESGCPG